MHTLAGNQSDDRALPKPSRKILRQAAVAGLSLAALVQTASAQSFAYTNNDLLLGFRKTGVNKESYEVVVNIGKAATYTSAAVGTTLNVPNFTLAQLVPDSFSTLNNLNWSVFGYVKTNKVAILPGYLNNTLWLTVPRADSNVRSSAPNRLNYSAQVAVATEINSIGANAGYLSSLTASNQDNTAKFIREPVDNPSDLSAFMASLSDSTASTLHDSWVQNNLENTSPGTFTSPVVSDLYEVWPTTDAQGNPVTDPHSHLTGGAAYYVGYFQLNANGTMTFTRGSSSQPPSSPPPPQLSISRSGGTTTISLATTNGATYTLYYTNALGLSAPLSAWPASPTTITGDGNPKSFTDTTTDSDRVYRVGAR